MKIFEQLERIKHIHRLIELQTTGTPNEFAKKIHISRRQLYYIIDDLKIMGAPIQYDAKSKTFYYTDKCEISFSFEIEVLSEEEISNISGGEILYNNNEYLNFYKKIYL
jgi:predicted DNA-binding transcriptional regulator YafY